MSVLEDVAGLASKTLGTPAGQTSPLVKAVLGLLGPSGPGGASGLTALVDGFKSKGLGEIASSWVGTGPNLPVTPQQIQTAMGGTQLQQIASKAGLDPTTASTQLATVLPQIVDKLTPEGKIPKGDVFAGAKTLVGKAGR